MKKFLLIDDHMVVRSGVKSLLAELFSDHEVHEAAYAVSALEKFKLRKVDLVLMDVQVPGSDMLSLMECIHLNIRSPRCWYFP